MSICRKTKNKKGRASGGILVYYKKELSNFLSVLDKSHENIIRRKLSKALLKTPMNAYIGGVYIAQKTQVKQNIMNVIL